MIELFGNLGEIIWQGANGNCIEPDPTAKFGVQTVITWKGDKSCWRAAEIPASIEQWVKVNNACMIDGRIVQPPDDDPSFGWLVAIGDTIEEAIDTLKEHAVDLPDGLSVDVTSLAELLTEVHAAEAQDMPFTEQTVPKPSTVIE